MPEMRVASLPGSAGRANEDAYALLPDLLVVADGATAPATLGDGCVHGPAWYANRLVDQVVVAHTDDPSAKPSDVLAEAIGRTTAAHSGTCDIAHPGTPSATVAMLAIDSRSRVHWLVLGDATVVLDSRDSLQLVSDDRLSNSSKAERAAIFANGRLSVNDHTKRISALVQAQRSHRNRPGGFWVAASDPRAAREALVGELDCTGSEGLRRAALLSDGAARAVDTYRLMSWRAALDFMTVQGPARLLDAIRDTEARDVEGIEFPRMKASDDATAALVSWVGGP